jgi:putative membrane protein
MNIPLMTWIVHWLVSAAALYLTALLVPGFRIKNYGSALIASAVIGVANVLIRPVLLFLTFPLTIITLGLFIFVVDAIVLRICAGLLKNFDISGWLSAFVGALVLAVLNTILHFVMV